MDRCYADALDIEAIARSAHLSRAHFIRSFRDAFGETPHRYLQRRRIERAMSLLRETDSPVTEVCLEVGFNSLGCILNTENCRATYAELMEKGVEGIQEPVDRFYGTDAAIRDPFGNHIRITQPVPDDEFEAPKPGDPEFAASHND